MEIFLKIPTAKLLLGYSAMKIIRTQLLNYLSSNAIMIAVILLVTLVALIGFAKLKNSIVPVGIAIIAACQVVQVIQLVYPQ